MSYQEKYLKYKKKYLKLKNQQSMKGGNFGFKLGQKNFTETGLPNALSPLESEVEDNQQVPVQAGGFFGFKFGLENMTDNQLPEVLSPIDTDSDILQPPVEFSVKPVEPSVQPVEQPMLGGKNNSWMEDSDLELSSVTDLSSDDSLSDFDL
jgi:hypothetical protein